MGKRIKIILLQGRKAILVFLTHQIALPVLKIFRKPGIANCTRDELCKLPPGSLGHDLYLFLEKRKLPLMPHYIRHDLKHVLLDYDTTEEGEACLQCFMLGSGRISFPVLATVAYAFITMPEYWRSMQKSYRKGRQAVFFHNWPWVELLPVPTALLRAGIIKN
jgi:ubiquinone biosynthesis protein Coq4